MAKKIYLLNNYLFVEDTVTTKQEKAPAKDVNIESLTVGSKLYYFKDLFDRIWFDGPIPLTDMIDVNDVAFTEQGWLDFYTNYTGDAYSVNPEVNKDFILSVMQGLVPGYSAVDKFGENPLVDTGTIPEDIWEGGGLYSYDADGTAPIISLVSSDGGDTQDIEIEGLDINGDPVTQTITLTGATRAALTTPLWRVYRMSNEGTVNVVGLIYCYTSVGNVPNVTEIRAIINNGNNQTLMALYTIPKGKVGFLHRGELGMSRSQSTGAVQAAYYSRRLGKIFKIKKRVDITNQGNSVYQDSRSFPDIIPSLTDIKLTIEDVSANGIGVFGTFDILLVDETKFTLAYLQAIGQPGY